MGKGFGTGKPQKGKQYQKAYVDFLIEVLQTIAKSNSDPEVVYPLLETNLDKLDNNFADLLRSRITPPRFKSEQNLVQGIGAALMHFSSLMRQFSLGIKANNLEIAITAYEVVTTIFTREASPEDWAMTQYNLGNAYRERILGKRVSNLELAIQCYDQALQVYTNHAFPEYWARIQSNLGTVYRDRIFGDKTSNLELAIQCHNQALKVYTREAFPQSWAEAQNNLGNAYRERIMGDRASNLESAIQCYNQALQVYTREAFPQNWAGTQNNLSTAYQARILGDRELNLEIAIQCLEVALQVYTREAFPQEWARTQNHLGLAYRDRILGKYWSNLEIAIQCLEAALQVYTCEAFPQEWAGIQSNLGVVYCDRILGDKESSLELAIKCYKRTLQIYTFEDFPYKWADTQINLGNAYRDRILGDGVSSLESANSNTTMGELFVRSIVDSASNLESAVQCYEMALQIYTRDEFPRNWAGIQNNLGLYYCKLQNIPEALHAFRLALAIHSPTADPVEGLRTGRNLGNTAFGARLWTEATQGYAPAIDAIEQSRDWATTEKRRQEILAEAIDVYENMVQACINAGQLEKAIEYVERSRSKRLVDLMASNDLYQGGEIHPKVKELLQQFDDLQQRIDQERSQNNFGNNRELMGMGSSRSDRATFQAYNEAIASLEAQKQQLWNQIRSKDPVLAGEIQVNAPDFSAMQNLIDQATTAILSFYTTNNDTHIFVLRQNQITLHTCTGQGLETLQAWIFQNWLKPYVEDKNTWQSEISSFLEELAQRLQISTLIAQHLEGITELILVPHLALHQIPLAVLPIGNTKYLGDKFLIRYTPSCQILEFCQQRGEVKDNLTYGIVEDATDDLPCASFEGEQIAQLHQISNNRRLRGSSQATRDNYRQLAKQVQVLHSCHHAESCLNNPLNSQLKLGDGSITLGQLMTPGWRLPELSDVFLSCCETGLGLPEITDDILTLSTGFLCAGARSVVSTLWSVDDLATTLFSLFYYQHRKQGQNRSQALQQAQIKLRQLKKDDLAELTKKVDAERKQARSKRNQYQPNSAEYLEWDREYSKYAKVTKQIHSVKNSQDKEPFSHPRYWAAFTCSGLR